MISVHLSRRALRRTLAAISAGVVAFGVLGAVPSATARPQASDGKVVTKQQPARALGAGRYVVVLRDPGATRYDGGVAGLQATKVKPGKSFDAPSDRQGRGRTSVTWSSSRTRLASTVGAQVGRRTTLATNAFTASLTARQATTLVFPTATC